MRNAKTEIDPVKEPFFLGFLKEIKSEAFAASADCIFKRFVSELYSKGEEELRGFYYDNVEVVSVSPGESVAKWTNQPYLSLSQERILSKIQQQYEKIYPNEYAADFPNMYPQPPRKSPYSLSVQPNAPLLQNEESHYYSNFNPSKRMFIGILVSALLHEIKIECKEGAAEDADRAQEKCDEYLKLMNEILKKEAQGKGLRKEDFEVANNLVGEVGALTSSHRRKHFTAMGANILTPLPMLAYFCNEFRIKNRPIREIQKHIKEWDEKERLSYEEQTAGLSTWLEMAPCLQQDRCAGR